VIEAHVFNEWQTPKDARKAKRQAHQNDEQDQAILLKESLIPSNASCR
jgi:hypothetical protein